MASMSRAKSLGAAGDGGAPILGAQQPQQAAVDSKGVWRLKACVVYDTRFGNTEKIAKSFESGLKEAGIETECVRSTDAEAGWLTRFDLVCIGGPTEAFSASKPIKEFFRGLKGDALSGKFGFAFDTKLDWRLSGSAAKFIEKALKDLGLRIVSPHESAIVATVKSGGQIVGAKLKDGEEGRFQKLGEQVGGTLAAAVKTVTA
jgi:flavodoxin